MPEIRGSQTYDDERLIRYLIGSLDEQETERFDELSISDDEFADRLRVVEDELIDAYARGELSGDTSARFETHYLSLPGKRDRTRFAEAWMSYQRRGAAPGSAPMPSASSRRPTKQAFVWPLVAAASLAIAVVGYVLLERSNRSAPVEPVPSAVATKSPKSEPGGVAAEPSANRPPPIPVAIVLMPSTRGIGEPPILSISRGALTVDIRLVLEGDDFPTYNVALEDAASERVLWNGVGLRSAASGADRIVVATIDAGLLKPQRYTLELSGHRASGGSELITSYPFRVMLK